MRDSGYASLLGRQDQVLVAALVLASLLAMAVYWLRAGGHRGQLVDMDQAAPTSARFTVDINRATWPELAAAAGHRRDSGAAHCRVAHSWTDPFATRVICSEFMAWDPNCWSVSNHFCCPSGQAATQAPRRGQVTVRFQLESPFQPAGDQPQAIAALIHGLREDRKHQVLMGVTGSGKTFTMANVIQQVQRPTLVISHNKTLAAQLYCEFQVNSFRTTPCIISSAITITTSPKHTSRSATSTSRRTPRSTPTLTGCGWPRPARWSAAAM